MRQTNYANGYGYVTQQDYATQQGHGIFDTLVKGVTNILTSDKTKQIVVEGAKAAAKSAGDKAGSKLVDSLASREKAFNRSEKPLKSVNKQDNKQPATGREKTSAQLLKEIYGESILGKGIVKVNSK